MKYQIGDEVVCTIPAKEYSYTTPRKYDWIECGTIIGVDEIAKDHFLVRFKDEFHDICHNEGKSMFVFYDNDERKIPFTAQDVEFSAARMQLLDPVEQLQRERNEAIDILRKKVTQSIYGT